MPNRLAGEKSPYLLQHAENPVDWFPWGEEAFLKAEKEDRPIFLSIGYATCHWCHVMAHESFEDHLVAKLLNEHFVAVKVDREERPDLDHIYMTACQALTGHGGWPLSVFLTPDRKPFFAGTYFPKLSREGSVGFVDLLMKLSDFWYKDRGRIVKSSGQIAEALKPKPGSGAGDLPGMELLDAAYGEFKNAFDAKRGGFGAKPKFPTPHNLVFLQHYHARKPESDALSMVTTTLDAMRNGGMFDQVGFGFHRYSVDENWLVPHFEKMLYDQALLAMAYLEGYRATGNSRYAGVTREIFEYVLRDMTDSSGGFYSAEDADSEGSEGLFYVWTPERVKAVLGEEQGDVFCRFYGITPDGNFEEGFSIPHVTKTVEAAAEEFGMDSPALNALLREGREKLFTAREKRVHPHRMERPHDRRAGSWSAVAGRSSPGRGGVPCGGFRSHRSSPPVGGVLPQSPAGRGCRSRRGGRLRFPRMGSSRTLRSDLRR